MMKSGFLSVYALYLALRISSGDAARRAAASSCSAWQQSSYGISAPSVAALAVIRDLRSGAGACSAAAVQAQRSSYGPR